MTAFPPRDRLDALLASLSRHLPESHATLLSAPELAEGQAALAELADPDCRSRVVADLDPALAGWLADAIEARWARLGGVRLDPAACILGPVELWFAGATAELCLDVAVLGLAAGPEIEWPPGFTAEEAGQRARMQVPAPTGGEAAELAVLAKVIGRVAGEAGGRVVLHARKAIRLRRPVLRLDAERRELLVQDQAGQPAAGLALIVDGVEHAVPADGRLRLADPLARAPLVEIGGQAVALAGM